MRNKSNALKRKDICIIAVLAVFSFIFLTGFVPYTPDANTVLIDHFDGATTASILAYRETGAACGSAKPSATPSSSYVAGAGGFGQALGLTPPVGEPDGSSTYLLYPGGQLLSQANGTIEFWVYLTSYGSNLTLVSQGPYPGSCAGWTFGMIVTASGVLQASAWDAFNLDSGANTVPLNTWTHVAASWGSAGAKLYINGVQVGSDTNTGMPASGFSGSVMLNYSAHVGILIDELRISNIQRTSFNYAGGSLSFSGWVKSLPNWPATSGASAVNGVTVSALQPGTPPTPVSSTAPDGSTGAFSLTGIPAATNFFLSIHPPAGYMPVLSKVMNWSNNIQAQLPFALFTHVPVHRSPVKQYGGDRDDYWPRGPVNGYPPGDHVFFRGDRHGNAMVERVADGHDVSRDLYRRRSSHRD